VEQGSHGTYRRAGGSRGPHLESCFQGQHLIPKDRADEKGAREGQ
jgi:hypothetical protein